MRRRYGLPHPLRGQKDAAPSDQPPPADELFDVVRKLARRMLVSAKREDKIAAELGVSTMQARAWMLRLVEEGSVEKLTRPVRYRRIEKLLLPATGEPRESPRGPASDPPLGEDPD